MQEETKVQRCVILMIPPISSTIDNEAFYAYLGRDNCCSTLDFFKFEILIETSVKEGMM